jgi:hypothetical protein
MKVRKDTERHNEWMNQSEYDDTLHNIWDDMTKEAVVKQFSLVQSRKALRRMLHRAEDIARQIEVHSHSHVEIARTLFDDWTSPDTSEPTRDTEPVVLRLDAYYDVYKDFTYKLGDVLCAVHFDSSTQTWKVCKTLPTQMLASSGIPCVGCQYIPKLISILQTKFPEGVSFNARC